MTIDSKRPKLQGSESNRELDRAREQIDNFEEQVKNLTLDTMNKAPKQETENQCKLSQNEISDSKDIYIKPKRSISSRETFNEKFREQARFAKEYVYFTAQHNEMKGENIEFWTKPFPGMPAEEWCIPTGIPIWAPRHVAERIKSSQYHEIHMSADEKSGYGGDQYGNQYVQKIAAKKTINRLDAFPATKQKSIFMGSNSF